MRIRIPANLKIDLDLPVNIEPADPKALGRLVRKGRWTLLAAGAGIAAGAAVSAFLSKAGAVADPEGGDE